VILETAALAAALCFVVAGIRGPRRIEVRECRCFKPAGDGERCACCMGLRFGARP
jgi:hypothetical protein